MPKGIFHEPLSDLGFLLLFAFECRVFLYDSSVLFGHTEQLAGHMAVFISKSPRGIYKLSLAAGFQLSLDLLCLTRELLWVQILYRDPHGCIAVPVVTGGH